MAWKSIEQAMDLVGGTPLTWALCIQSEAVASKTSAAGQQLVWVEGSVDERHRIERETWASVIANQTQALERLSQELSAARAEIAKLHESREGGPALFERVAKPAHQNGRNGTSGHGFPIHRNGQAGGFSFRAEQSRLLAMAAWSTWLRRRRPA